MKLQQFIEQTINAIMDGVKASQRHARTVGGKVVPGDMYYHE